MDHGSPPPVEVPWRCVLVQEQLSYDVTSMVVVATGRWKEKERRGRERDIEKGDMGGAWFVASCAHSTNSHFNGFAAYK